MTKRFLMAAGISLAMTFTFSCSGDSNESPPDQSVSSSSGGGGGKGSSSSGGGSSSSDALSSSLEVSSSSSDALSSSSVSSSSGGSSSSSSGDASSSSHVHVWGNWVTTTPATCSAAGEETRTCTDDGSEEKRAISMISYDSETHYCHDGKVVEYCGSRTETFDPDLYECRTGDKIYLKTPISYEGESYEAVLIGEQTWLAKNLNYNASGSRCSGDNTGGDSQNNCGTYGRLYNWATAMAGAASSTANPSGVQGVCPSGWHLPSQAEWDALTAFIQSDKGCSSCDAKHLKAESGWNSNRNGEDSYGFTALPGGGGNFDDVGYYGYWWSASEYSSFIAYVRHMYYLSEYASWDSHSKDYLFSVRCLQD